MKKLCNYYYSLSKNNKNIGEQSIDIIRNGNEEFISIELFLIGKKVTVNVKYVDGLLEYYVKNTLESGMLKEEKLNSIQKNEYSFYRNGKEGTIVSGKPLGLFLIVCIQIVIIVLVKEPTQRIIKKQTKIEQELVKQVNTDYRDIIDVKLLNYKIIK